MLESGSVNGFPISGENIEKVIGYRMYAQMYTRCTVYGSSPKMRRKKKQTNKRTNIRKMIPCREGMYKKYIYTHIYMYICIHACMYVYICSFERPATSAVHIERAVLDVAPVLSINANFTRDESVVRSASIEKRIKIRRAIYSPGTRMRMTGQKLANTSSINVKSILTQTDENTRLVTCSCHGTWSERIVGSVAAGSFRPTRAKTVTNSYQGLYLRRDTFNNQ